MKIAGTFIIYFISFSKNPLKEPTFSTTVVITTINFISQCKRKGVVRGNVRCVWLHVEIKNVWLEVVLHGWKWLCMPAASVSVMY